MDVRYSPEQRALRDSVAQIVDRMAPQAVGQFDDDERSAKLDAAIEASGWRELRAPDTDGSPWASAVEVAIVAEMLGRGAADAPFIGPTLAGELRRAAGVPTDGIRETVALRADLSTLGTPRERTVAIDAMHAESALILGEGNMLTSIPVPPSSRSTDVDLTRATIPLEPVPGIVLGFVPPGAQFRWTALVLAMTTADLVGTMQGAIALTRSYVAERNQFGRPIGSFQAVQHLLADAVVYLEGSRAASLYASWAVDALEPLPAMRAAAVAKAYATRAALTVHETAIQLHGGIGSTWECFAHVHLRRALLSADIGGGIGLNLERVLQHAGVQGAA